MSDRISTLDSGYRTGDLSIFPEAKDDKVQLYKVRNNAETKLYQSLSYGGKYVLVEDTSSFPDQGLIMVGTEQIYYNKKTSTSFQDLKRGFAGSRQNQWMVGTRVVNAVFAEPHNACKDAIINMQTKIGTSVNPDPASLNGILKKLETRYLSPKPVFRSLPVKGPSPLTVKFQNFSAGDPIRYLWDFGDGQTSVEVSPVHTYLAEGSYTVKLNMISSSGAQGIATKTDYIVVDNSLQEGFYYVNPVVGTTATTFTFVDQTPGDVASRYWIFDDGNTHQENDPDIHTVTHQYSAAGSYKTTLIVVFSNQRLSRFEIEPILVT